MHFEVSYLDDALARGSCGLSSLGVLQPEGDVRYNYTPVGRIIRDPRNYLIQTGPLRCIDDRFDYGGLIGGALSLALMHNFIRGGAPRRRRLSNDLVALRRLGFTLWMHHDCTLTSVVDTVKSELTADDSKLRELQPTYGMGYLYPDEWEEVQRWASGLSERYVDTEERAFQKVRSSKGGAVARPMGEHRTAWAVIVKCGGKVFAASDEVAEVAAGHRPLLTNSWRARQEAAKIPGDPWRQEVAAKLANLLTLDAMRRIGASDLAVIEVR